MLNVEKYSNKLQLSSIKKLLLIAKNDAGILNFKTLYTILFHFYYSSKVYKYMYSRNSRKYYIFLQLFVYTQITRVIIFHFFISIHFIFSSKKSFTI